MSEGLTAQPDRRTLAGDSGVASHPRSAGQGAVATLAPSSRPVVVAGCFGWLHWAPTANGSVPQSEVAVLICPALGWDGLHSYHGFRLLADSFAAWGYPAMRFQYPGTGNSADPPVHGHGSGADPWAAWQRSVDDVADWLREATGATRLILIGLRIGASLAVLAAERRSDVAGLVLLAPVIRGKSYVRQLDMEARLEGGGGSTPTGGGLAFHELHLSDDTVQRIAALDIRHCKLQPGSRAALFPQAPSQLADGCVQTWRAAGIEVATGGFEGLEPLLQEAIHFDPAPADGTSVLAWARLNVPLPPWAQTAELNAPAPPRLDLPGCTETPIAFGTGGRLFGILCRPAGEGVRKAVLIGNTGRDPHFGIARLGVEFARRLAREGIASLRFDFTGLGDSPSPPGGSLALSPLFETDRNEDFSAAIDALMRLGYREFAVQGVCSGAYHAFQAARVDPRISALLVVNLPVFQWQGGDSVRSALWKSAPASRVLERLLQPDVWKRAVRGKIDWRPIVLSWYRRAAARVAPLFGRMVAEEAWGTAAGTMAGLARRKVAALFLYSASDPGLDPLGAEFGRDGERLADYGGVTLRIVQGLDHVLSAHAMREVAIDHMLGFLTHTGADQPHRQDPSR